MEEARQAEAATVLARAEVAAAVAAAEEERAALIKQVCPYTKHVNVAVASFISIVAFRIFEFKS